MKLKLRVARSTNQLQKIASMYQSGLGFEVLGSFQDHQGFDGIMLGTKSASYHLEFTQQKGHAAPHSNSTENLLVFYLPDAAEYQLTCQRMLGAGFRRVPAHNPYWDQTGTTFEDPEAYRVVISENSWNGN